MTAAKNPHKTANPELAKAMHGLRSSSAASPHVPKPRRGTRTAQARRAIDESR
ncbi:hypothetical protein [Xylanimonas sp. McL0601]|uniref:hypothetical protein n=1 Tax=Xylanimonas sp. McL0601 TaxID=3414739 RepID=UPI003CF7214B